MASFFDSPLLSALAQWRQLCDAALVVVLRTTNQAISASSNFCVDDGGAGWATRCCGCSRAELSRGDHRRSAALPPAAVTWKMMRAGVFWRCTDALYAMRLSVSARASGAGYVRALCV